MVVEKVWQCLLEAQTWVNIEEFSVFDEFVLWEFSIVSSLSWYSILVQYACNDRAWLTFECSPRKMRCSQSLQAHRAHIATVYYISRPPLSRNPPSAPKGHLHDVILRPKPVGFCFFVQIRAFDLAGITKFKKIYTRNTCIAEPLETWE